MTLREARCYFKHGDASRIAREYGCTPALVYAVIKGDCKNPVIESTVLELGKKRKAQAEAMTKKIVDAVII